MAKTAAQLLTGVKRRILQPANQALFTDVDILAFADGAISSVLVPILMSVRQEFFTTIVDIPVLGGQDTYDIPTRAIARSLREVKLRDSTGGIFRDLAMVLINDVHLFSIGGSPGSTPHSFYLKGDQMVLVPMPQGNGMSIECWYEIPPSSLISTTSAAQITNITGNVLTVSNVPSTFVPMLSVDLIRGKSGNSILSMDIPIINISGSQITINASDVPVDELGSVVLEVGDWISPAGQSPVIMLPNECFRFLETLTAVDILRSIGDFDAANILAPVATMEEKNLKMILEPRVQGEATKIINRRSLMRGARSRYRRGLIY